MTQVLIKPTPGDESPTAKLLWGEPAHTALSKLKSSSVHAVITELPVPGAGWGGVPTLWPDVSYQPLPELDAQISVASSETPFGEETNSEEFIAHAIMTFRSVGKVLRPDGTLWVHVRDRYSKDKQLSLIPQRLALAMQAEGWYLRNEIIWNRENAVPDSVKDRLTQSHGTILFFAHPMSKGKGYFYDADPLREPHISQDEKHISGYNKDVNLADGYSRRPALEKAWHPKGRNKRTVWNVNLGAYLGQAISPWPAELVEPMIKASISEGGCCENCGSQLHRGAGDEWVRACGHTGKVVRPTVLDPFAGTSTTGKVALDWGANFIGIDIDDKVLPEARARLEGVHQSRRAAQESQAENPAWEAFTQEGGK